MDKKSFVLRSFASIAKSYDLVNTLLSLGLHVWWRREAVNALGLSGSELVLDCCAGTMRLGRTILKQWNTARVAALDFSLVMLGRGMQKKRGGSLIPVGGDAAQLPFAERTFDRVIVGFGIRNLEDPRAGIVELFRVLKRGGRMVILEFGRPTLPVFRGIYLWYLSRFIPWAGGIISGHKVVYQYLHESIMAFPEPDELMSMMHNAGFAQIRYQKLTGGIASLYTGKKV